MREFRFFYGIILAMIIAMNFAYISRLSPILLFTVLAVPAVSFVLLLISFCAVKVSADSVPSSVTRKDETGFDIFIKNRFIMPLTPVKVYVKVCVENKSVPEYRVIVVNIPPMKSVKLKVANVMSFRGEYIVGMEKTEIFDLLKLFKLSRKNRGIKTVVVTPREIPLKALRDDNAEDDESARAKPDGFNKNTFSHLREYREGDTLRHIHWKLSAKQDELIVKQMEQNYNNAALVFCDFTTFYPNRDEAMAATDIIIESALALTRHILRGGNEALFMLQDAEKGESITRELNDERDYKALERELTFLPAENFNGEFTDLFDEHKDDISVRRSIYIVTAALTEAFIEKLLELGLTVRRNVTVVVVTAGESGVDAGKLDYLINETRIAVCRVENDDVAASLSGLVG